MNGASREALAAARERLDALTDNTSVDAGAVASELASFGRLLDREVALRRFLTDPAQDGQAKADLLGRLLTGQVRGETLDLLGGMVRSRWSRPRDLADAVEELSVTAELVVAEREGRLDDVEDELFRFSRILQSSTELRQALTDRSAPGTARGDLIGSLLGGKAHAVTERLITRLVTHPRGLSLDVGLENYSRLAAARRGRMVAVVTTAVPLSSGQKDRLGSVLARLYGRDVHLNLDVDPEVRGGISVRVGDEVIDGSISSRLDEAARRLAG
ncbi:ATP synthase F0F1 subunit delta [Wenjunlia vitaminophila]|uniref:ATP synthase subunit delta n=1 Tax=Wenjunlia vitaminophila TaxID=76728 RepID=A0A0T6LTP6_WENVI|nr:F0F1 ATP synthase subunit delta [Wenjunlia vitaminophila]KRV49466.1 ATP synthase F0F1 subunit delta [Wenjunlia vitaminophila]